MRFLMAFALLLVTGTALSERLPIEDFFKDAEFTSVSLSPTGEYITVSVPEGDRTLLAAFRVSDMELVGKWDYGANKHIDRVRWVNDERFLLFVSEKVGRYDFRVGRPDVYASNVDGTQRADIPNGGTYQIVDTLDSDPRSILVSRSIDSAFLFRLDVYDGRTRTVATAPIRFGSFLVDRDGAVRYAIGSEESGASVTLRRQGEDWEEVHTSPMGGSVRFPLGFAEDGKSVYFAVSEDGGPSRIVLIDPETREERELAGNPHVDPVDMLPSSSRDRMLAVAFMDGYPEYNFIDAGHEESRVYAGLINAFPDHAVSFSGVSRDGRYILFRAYSDVDPGSFYLFDRQENQAKFLLASRDWIDPEKMSPMRPFSMTARDGTRLHGYLTLPAGVPPENLPLILHPHGGPHGPRDMWGFNPDVQFLANRGYAVLQINFRGSGGYGQAFERMGYRNWGTTMIDDMTDAVRFVAQQGIADANRVCVYGASYGGYAALQSVVREPDMYRCAIGYVGLYSKDLWMRDSDVARRDEGRAYQAQVFPETQAERQAQSPADQVDRINVPVMLVHGARDQRVPISQYNLLKRRLEEAGKPPEETIVERNEQHGFYDLGNQVNLYTRMEAFLDRHIGDKRQTAATP